jgi:hypothetical protein
VPSRPLWLRDRDRTSLLSPREENWNGGWRQWISQNPNASKEEVIEQLNNMKVEFGVGGQGGEIDEDLPIVPE